KTYHYFAASGVVNTTFVAFEDLTSGSTMGFKSVNYTYGSSGPGSIKVIQSVSSADSLNTAYTTDLYGNLYVTAADVSKNWIKIYKSVDGGNSWTKFTTVIQPESNQKSDSLVAYYSTANLTGIGWLQGPSIPYNIRFASLPLVIPDASIFTDPSSRP